MRCQVQDREDEEREEKGAKRESLLPVGGAIPKSWALYSWQHQKIRKESEWEWEL